MAFHRSIRNRRGRKKIHSEFELQLTSMMDVLVIIVVFLLKSYATSTNNLTAGNLKLPLSGSPDTPTDSLQVIVTPEAVSFENERVVEFVQTAASLDGEPDYSLKKDDLDEGGRRIVRLYDALMRAREKSELLRTKSQARDQKGNPLPFHGVLAIQADKRVRYETIRKVMYSAAAAGYTTFRFIALQRDS